MPGRATALALFALANTGRALVCWAGTDLQSAGPAQFRPAECEAGTACSISQLTTGPVTTVSKACTPPSQVGETTQNTPIS